MSDQNTFYDMTKRTDAEVIEGSTKRGLVTTVTARDGGRVRFLFGADGSLEDIAVLKGPDYLDPPEEPTKYEARYRCAPGNLVRGVKALRWGEGIGLRQAYLDTKSGYWIELFKQCQDDLRVAGWEVRERA